MLAGLVFGLVVNWGSQPQATKVRVDPMVFCGRPPPAVPQASGLMTKNLGPSELGPLLVGRIKGLIAERKQHEILLNHVYCEVCKCVIP